MDSFPRGVEVLIKKAAVDGAFRERLLAERAGAADLIGLTLTPAEAALLAAIPAKQLAATIARTTVAPALKPAFAAYAAAAMVAALGVTSCCPNRLGGARPDLPPVTDEKDAPDAGAVEGVVRDDGGKPVAGAQVELTGTDYAATADKDGRFRMKNIPVGNYQIYARYGGYMQLAPADVTVVAGETATVELTVRYLSPPGGARPDIP
jgi:hypothetical protein